MNSKIKKNLKSTYILFKNKKNLENKINKIGPWYQTFNFKNILKIYAHDKNKNKISPFSKDRGLKKWEKFIEPYLPIEFNNKRILEVGTNAGLYLYNSIIKKKAKFCLGIEPDKKYLKQAKLVKKIYEIMGHKNLPIEFYPETMEKLDFNLMPNFDICMFLSSIYHINERGRKNAKDVFYNQVNLLNKASKHCEYFIFLANGLVDEGRGKGGDSLKEIIKKSTLTIIKENHIKDSRGHLIIAKSKIKFEKKLPLNIMINKYFKKPKDSAEFEFLSNNKKNYKNSIYYLLRTKKITWEFPFVSNFPNSLKRKPVYWLMPWAKKIRLEKFNQSYVFNKNYIFDFYRNIKKKNEKINNTPIEGYLLINNKNKKRFIYTDGNHRMAIYKKLNLEKKKYNYINVKIIHTIHEKNLNKLYLNKIFTNEKIIDPKDSMKWFNNAFLN